MEPVLTRRELLAGIVGGAAAPARTTQPEPDGFFTVGQRSGRWWFIDPAGKLFFSIGFNHIDPAPLRGAGGDIWRGKYANSQERWLKESVRPDLENWGFNSAGWVQEVVTRGVTNHRHSRSFTYEEYQWLGMPYCHLLRFADFHQWEAETRNPSLKSPEFADWCDYVARDDCARFAGDPKLIGYFYIDCPTWAHTTQYMKWKGPILDPGMFQSEAGRREAKDTAGHYYKLLHDSIRRYDPHHLILGDRYEANAPLPLEVVEAARPWVDVLSFQDFKAPVEQLRRWHESTGMPVLWADGAKGIPAEGGWLRNDGAWWAAQLAGLRENPGCIGAHLCGAYLRNGARRRGLRDERERPDEENIELIRDANRRTSGWVAEWQARR